MRGARSELEAVKTALARVMDREEALKAECAELRAGNLALTLQLAEAEQRATRAEAELQMRFSFSGMQRALLHVLAKVGSSSAPKLAAEIRRTVHSVHAELQGLVNLGYVEMTRQQHGTRIYRLSTTAVARRARDSARALR